MSFWNTGVSDPAPRLLREVTARPGVDDVSPSLRAVFSGTSAQANGEMAVSAFLNHRIVTHLFRQLDAAGIDIAGLTVADAIWNDCSTNTVVPAIDRDAAGRVPLGRIRQRLDHHRNLQRRMITLVAETVPLSFLVMFGQGIALAHPEYRERFSHDIDLVVSTAAEGEAMVAQLNDAGFATTEDRSGSYRGVPFRDWTLDAADLDGHRMHVDLSMGAITRSDGWMKPVVLPDLFDAAQVISLPGPTTASVLVPSDTHQLILLAEKLQRTGRYDNRVRCDANALLRFGRVDLGFVTDFAHCSDLSNSLHWALGSKPGGGSRGLRDRTNALLIRAMARDTHRPSRLHKPAAKAFRRTCA